MKTYAYEIAENVTLNINASCQFEADEIYKEYMKDEEEIIEQLKDEL